MTVRSYLAENLSDSSELAALGLPVGGVLAGDVDTPSLRPFINLRWNITSAGLRDIVVRRFVNVWVHDQPNDYNRIDDLLLEIKKMWKAIEGANHGSGILVLVEWVSDSEDLSDNGHGTITKYSTYQVVCTEGIT